MFFEFSRHKTNKSPFLARVKGQISSMKQTSIILNAHELTKKAFFPDLYSTLTLHAMRCTTLFNAEIQGVPTSFGPLWRPYWAVFGQHFDTFKRPFWDRFGPLTNGPFCAIFEPILDRFKTIFGTIFGPYYDHFWTILGSIFRLLLNHFLTISDHFRTIWDHFRNHFKTIVGPF